MEKLPPELISQVLLYLNPLDRLTTAETCRRWAGIVASPSLLTDVVFSIHGAEYEAIEPILMRSPRQYSNLRIVGADAKIYNRDLWAKIGGQIRRLELIDCKFGCATLCFILEHCPKLESFALEDRWSQINRQMEDLSFAGKQVLERVRKSLRNVSHLDLNFRVTTLRLRQFLKLMPNVTSLSLFYKGTEEVELLPCLFETGQMFTEVDFRLFPLQDQQLRDFLKMYSGSLRNLRVRTYYLRPNDFESLANGINLQHLSLPEGSDFTDDGMEKIARGASKLETLDLSMTTMLTDVSMTHILSLKKLRYLSLADCFRISAEALCGVGMISKLQYLDLQGTQFDIRVLRSIAYLKHLRALLFTADLHSEGLDIICKAFRKLEKLKFGHCKTLTDADGVKLRLLDQLRDLQYFYSSGFTGQTYARGIGSPAMESLQLDSCPLTDASFAGIAAHHGRLRILRLFACYGATDVGFADFLRRQTFLEVLVLKACPYFTRKCLKELEKNCPRLQYLQIDHCPVSDRALELFQKKRPNVVACRHCSMPEWFWGKPFPCAADLSSNTRL